MISTLRQLVVPARLRRTARASVTLGIVMFGACAVTHARSATPLATPDLADRIAARIAAVPNARVGVAYLDPAAGDSLFIGADTAFHAASTMKVPILIELFRRHERGQFDVDGALPLRNEFRSIVDGSTYSLTSSSDSDSTLYGRVGERVRVTELAERMIVRSSNLATNALIEHLDADAINRTMTALGAPGMRVLRGVEDQKAYDAGLSNTTTARALATIMAAIEQGRAASPASTRAMRDMLLRQEFNDEIPAGLPAGTRVAHKTGWITATLHDAAIIYPPEREPYVLVILTGGIPDDAVARTLMQDVTRLVHEHATAAPRP